MTLLHGRAAQEGHVMSARQGNAKVYKQIANTREVCVPAYLQQCIAFGREHAHSFTPLI